LEIYGLVGASGTGKSHVAHTVAESRHADFIIDDGLLIQRGQIISGFSAKFELNKIAAVRRAIFTERGHREAVRTAIGALNASVGLVLGTSTRMIHTICTQLNLPPPTSILAIEAVTSAVDIHTASDRREQGMHAIPIVHSQLTDVAAVPDFVRKFWRRLHPASVATKRIAPTVVSPLFSEGAIFIHPHVIRDSIKARMTFDSYAFVFRKVVCIGREAPIIHVHVAGQYGVSMHQAGQALLHNLATYLQDYLALPYPELRLHIDEIIIDAR